MKKTRLLLLAIFAMALMSQGSALAGVVTTDQYKFLFNGLWTSTIPSGPAITATTSTTAGNSMFGIGSGGIGFNTGSTAAQFSTSAASGARGGVIQNLNGGVALSTTKKEVVEFDWLAATPNGDAGAYTAIGLSDAAKQPVFALAVENWGGAHAGVHLMNLKPLKLTTAFLFTAPAYVTTGNYKADWVAAEDTSAIGTTFPSGKSYHIKAKLDYATHLIDSIWITRNDSAAAQYIGANISFLSATATNVDRLSFATPRGKNATNSGNGSVITVASTIDNFSVYTWEVASTTSVTVNYYDADSPSTLITSVARPNQAIAGTYTVSGADKATFTNGGFNCVFSSVSLDNVTIAADGSSHVDLLMKKYATTSGAYTWTGLTDGSWNELNANFSTDGTNSLGYQTGNGLIFPEIASNKTVTVNDNFNLGANDLTISGEGYTLGGSAVLAGTGKLNIALTELQPVALGVTNNLTGTTQISGGIITLNKSGVLGAGVTTTGATSFITAANGVAIPTTTFGASTTINAGTNNFISIAGMSAASGVKISVANGYNHASVGTTGFDFAANGTLAAGSELELNGTGTDNRIGMTAASASYLANTKLSLKGAAMFYINTNQAAASTINVGTLVGEVGAKLGWGKSSALDRTITWSVGALNENSDFAGSITNLGGYNASGSSFTGTYTNFAKVGTGVLTMSGNTTAHAGTFAVNGGELRVTGSLGKSTNPITVSGTSKLSAKTGAHIFASTLAMTGTDTLLVGDSASVTVSTAVGTAITNVVIEILADTAGILVLPDGVTTADTLIVRELIPSSSVEQTYKIVNSASAAGLTFAHVSLPSSKYTYNQATGVLTYTFSTALNNAITNKASVYPTLTRDVVTVRETNAASIEVINITGSSVKMVRPTSDNTSISLKGLAKGTYIVKVRTANGATKVSKVVLQ